MSDIPMQADIPVDANGRIDIDLKCVSCGYNIRGLLRDGVCPECGTATARSCGSNHLQFSRPEWVEQLATGMNWIVAAIVIGFLGGCVMRGLMSTAATPAGGLLQQTLFNSVVALISLIGYWKVTSPEPRMPDDQREETLRQLARGASVLNFVLGLGAVAIASAPPVAAVLYTAATLIVSVVLMFSIFLYARRLALRVPNRELASQTTFVMWGIVACTAAGLVLFAAGALLGSPATRSGSGVGPLMVGACGVGLGFLVFGLWSLLLIDRYRRNFKEAARLARETWAAAGKPAPAA